MRQFIRHPVRIPIEVSAPGHVFMQDETHSSDLGSGGLAFLSQLEIEPGTFIQISIPHVKPKFETEAKVVWCRRRGHGSELGVEFLNSEDAFKARMVEQVCHIENYKNRVVAREGRNLSLQEAALEWVSKYAADFTQP